VVWSQCTASRGTYELDGCRVAFGAACCRSQNWISNFAPRSAAYAWYEAQMGTFVLPHLTSRRSVGSWPPKLARRSFDAHWPPPEAWYLGSTRIASCGRICPLTCKSERRECVRCMCYERSDRGRCGCCRVPHRPLLRSLTAPTDSHTRSPIQTPQKYHLTIASSHHLAASAMPTPFVAPLASRYFPSLAWPFPLHGPCLPLPCKNFGTSVSSEEQERSAHLAQITFEINL
jgi:hypothetical protein